VRVADGAPRRGAGGAPPIVARVTRAGRDESIHRGFGAVVGSTGSVLAAFGDPETSVYWRSAAKPFQALPFFEAGGDRAFGLTRDEIALACASHAGEPAHVAAALSMLEKGGFEVADLRCGAHPPTDDASAAALSRAGEAPSALHNNCSGKHAAMLLACRLFGFDPSSYDAPEHPLQRKILEKVAFYAGFPAAAIGIGIDGCSLPVFRLPLSRLAAAYARLVAAGALEGEGPDAAAARARIVGAMTGSPFFVSGTGQFTTRLIEAGRGRWIGKEGAEGVYAMAVVDPPRGIAFKVEDGGSRPRNAIACDLLGKAGAWPEPPAGLAGDLRPQLRNVRGTVVGEIVVDVALERSPAEEGARPAGGAPAAAAPPR
jgi:L-asparaginase II